MVIMVSMVLMIMIVKMFLVVMVVKNNLQKAELQSECSLQAESSV